MYPITQINPVQNPCTGILEPMVYFIQDNKFLQHSERNNNQIYVKFTGNPNLPVNPVYVSVDSVNDMPNSRPNLFTGTGQAALILRNVKFGRLSNPGKLGSFEIYDGVVAPGELVEAVAQSQPAPVVSKKEVKGLSELEISLMVAGVVLLVLLVFLIGYKLK
jgi:hypothetical protein